MTVTKNDSYADRYCDDQFDPLSTNAMQISADPLEEFKQDLASPTSGKGAALVGFRRTSAALDTDVQTMARHQPVHVAEYGAVGNGSNELAKLQAAWNAAVAEGVPIDFGTDKTYNVGTLSAASTELLFQSDSVMDVRGRNVRLTATMHNDVFTLETQHYGFVLDGGGNIEGITIETTNPNWSVAAGLTAFGVRASPGGMKGLTLKNCRAKNCLSSFAAWQGGWTEEENGVQNIHFENHISDNCYYGMNFRNTGDNVSGVLTAINPRRAYFIYGVHNHDMNIFIKIIEGSGNTLGSTGCIVVYSQSDGKDTSGIKTKILFDGNLNRYSVLVNASTQMKNASIGSKINGWHLHADFAASVANDIGNGPIRFQMNSYREPQAGDTQAILSSGKPNQFNGILITGNFLNKGESSNIAISQPMPTQQQTHVAFGSDVNISNWRRVMAPIDTVFRVAADREVRIAKGNVTDITFKIPQRHYPDTYSLKHSLVAIGAGGFNAIDGNAMIREDIICGTVAGQTAVLNVQQRIPVVPSTGPGTSPTVTFGGEQGYATVRMQADSTYSTGYAVLSTSFIGIQS